MDILPEAVEDAKKNSKINRIDNANFLSGPAEDLIPQMIQQAIHEEIVAVIGRLRKFLCECLNYVIFLFFRSSKSWYCNESY